MAEPDETFVPALSAAALTEWNRHVDSVLRGIAHGLNNRAAALGALLELTTEPMESPAVLRSIVSTEMERVQAIVRVVRAIGAPRAAVEAFTPGDAAAEALAVLELYPDYRDVVVSIDSTRGEPVRVVRWMFVRALMALVGGMTQAPARSRRLTMAAVDGWLEVAADEGAHGITPLALELAHAMQGEPLRGRYGFRVPTLASLRQREGR